MQIRIKGYTFQLSEPFRAGTVITKGEAQALNDLRAENIQNNLRVLVNKAGAELGEGELITGEVLAEIQAKISGYDAGYQFVEKHTSRPRIGDIEAEARQVAREIIDAELRRAGEAQGQPNEELLEQWITERAGLPLIIEAARDRVAARRKALQGTLSDL